MKTRKFSTRHLIINILLLVLIFSLYLLTSGPAVSAVINSFQTGVLYRGHLKDAVALECTVTWDAEALDPILELLKKRGVAISFFVSGEWAERNGDKLKQMAEAGHEIGIVGYYPYERFALDALEKDLSSAKRVVSSKCGVVPKLYMPLSQSNTIASKAAQEQGLVTVLCSIDTMGARGDSEKIAQRALQEPFSGALILISPTGETLKALPKILDGLEGKGFKILTAGQVLGDLLL